MSARGLSPRFLRSTALRLSATAPGRLHAITPPTSASGRTPVVGPAVTIGDPEDLVGVRAPAEWRGLAVVLPVLSHGADATLAYVLDRSGRSAIAVHPDDGPPELLDSSSEPVGLVVDICHRVLGLATAEEATTPTELVLRIWLQRLLDAAADPSAPGVADWAAAVDLHPAWRVDGRQGRRDVESIAALTVTMGCALSWERMRQLVADGQSDVPGIAPSDAAWMDWPFFARWTLDVHRPSTELLDDLSLFLDGPVLRDVRYTVESAGWLGFAGSHTASSGRAE